MKRKNKKNALSKVKYYFIKFVKWSWIKRILLILLCLSIVVLIYLVVYNFTELSHYFERDNAQGELFKVCLTTFAGIGAFVALYYSAKRVQAMEKGNVDTRFNDAVGHLGSENHTVVLGSIHTLHQIAVKHKSYTQVVHNLFCSYLRENSAKLYESIDFEKTPNKCPVIIQILIDYLFKLYNDKDSVYKNYKSDLSFIVLENVSFKQSKINDVSFYQSTLTKCVFDESTLTKCVFDGSLTHCNFRASTLINCDFQGALTECSFGRSTLTKCDFRGTLTMCNFFNSTLTMCAFNHLIEIIFPGKDVFKKYTLTNCNFLYSTLTKCAFGINLTECSFGRSTLTKCNFLNSTLTKCNFKLIQLIDTILPTNEK